MVNGLKYFINKKYKNLIDKCRTFIGKQKNPTHCVGFFVGDERFELPTPSV